MHREMINTENREMKLKLKNKQRKITGTYWACEIICGGYPCGHWVDSQLIFSPRKTAQEFELRDHFSFAICTTVSARGHGQYVPSFSHFLHSLPLSIPIAVVSWIKERPLHCLTNSDVYRNRLAKCSSLQLSYLFSILWGPLRGRSFDKVGILTI